MDNDIFQSRSDLSPIKETYEGIRNEIGKVIVGHEKMIDFLVIAMFCEGHVLLEGLPGVAKTLTAKCLSKTMDCGFSRIQFTPDLMPSDVIGAMMYNMKIGEFNFKKGPIFSNVILIDEINRSPAKTQAALFECMEEQQVTIDGINHKLESPFLVIGTQNPVDHEGTYRLPEAQLDRFMFKLAVEYPTLEQEASIIANQQSKNIKLGLQDIKKIITNDKLREIQGIINKVLVKEDLFTYIAQIVQNTRNHPALFLGASPRASLHILSASKALAAIQGRDFVTPEDIKEVVFPVLNHRVSLTPEKEMEGERVHDVLKQIIQKVDVPR